MGAGAWFFLSTILKLGSTTAAALWPLKVEDSLCDMKSFKGVLDLYTLANSNLDVWLSAVVHSLLLLAALWETATPKSPRHLRAMVRTPPFKQVRGPGWRAGTGAELGGTGGQCGAPAKGAAHNPTTLIELVSSSLPLPQVSSFIWGINLIYQLLLLAKAVAVATMGAEVRCAGRWGGHLHQPRGILCATPLLRAVPLAVHMLSRASIK